MSFDADAFVMIGAKSPAVAPTASAEPVPDSAVDWEADVPAPVMAWGSAVWDVARDPAADLVDEVEPEPEDFTAIAPEAPMWTDGPDVNPDLNPVWADPEPDTWSEEEPISFVAHPRRAAVSADPLARAWADRAEADVRAELQQVAEARVAEARVAAAPPIPGDVVADATQDGLFAEDAGTFDEEALRDIVRDIIREELAGTLGERITRNVRKLVRVEINRALSTREFE